MVFYLIGLSQILKIFVKGNISYTDVALYNNMASNLGHVDVDFFEY